MTPYPSILPLDYYLHDDVLYLGRDLLGKRLMTQQDGLITGGIIVETESYKGAEDRACHAYAHKRTPRNEAMYLQGGVAYVFHCYGMHVLFNVVTHKADIPHAVLIRAIEPTIGIEIMCKRRNAPVLSRRVAGGPGMLTQALGISQAHNQHSLHSTALWIEDIGLTYSSEEIIASPRVGVDYAGEDALLPWRFRVLNCPWTSPAK